MSFQLPHNPDDLLRKPLVDEQGKNRFADDQPPTETSQNPFTAPQDTSEQPAYQPDYVAALPHRGKKIFVLGLLGALGSIVSVLAVFQHYYFVAAINLSLTLTAAAMGRRDLRGIRKGAVDVGGRTLTRWGFWLGIVGSLISLGVLAYLVWLLIGPNLKDLLG